MATRSRLAARFRGCLSGGLLASAALACQTSVGDYRLEGERREPAEAGVAPTAVQALCDVEQREFTFELALASQDRLADLTAYYERQNPELVAHLVAVADEFTAGREHSAVTYFMGSAGVGKSFVVRNALGAFSDEQQCAAELTPLFTEDVDDLGFEIERGADLSSHDPAITFNELPAIAEPSSFDLVDLLRAAGCLESGTLPPLVVVDGIDELGDESASTILEAIDRLVLEGGIDRGPFLHVIAAGRPEGFAARLTDPGRTEEHAELVERFIIEPPRYESAGDLAFRLEGYLEFADLLAGAQADGSLQAHLDSFTRALETHPFLTYTIGNLALGNIVIENTAPGLEQSEQALKVGLLDDMLVRNAETHGRPGSGSALDDVYRQLLEEVAARYLGEVDERGVFSVSAEDSVEAVDARGERLARVRVRSLLNRSGVALLTSVTAASTRYRFDPFWVHAHLVERRNQRLHPDYEYRGCGPGPGDAGP